jgi:hypothetical protein
MRAAELIQELQRAAPELQVYVWINGQRLRVTAVNHSYTKNAGGFVELTAEAEAGLSWPSVYIVTNHNGTELGQFDTLDKAKAEAKFYKEQTGNPAFIEEDLKTPAY